MLMLASSLIRKKLGNEQRLPIKKKLWPLLKLQLYQGFCQDKKLWLWAPKGSPRGGMIKPWK